MKTCGISLLIAIFILSLIGIHVRAQNSTDLTNQTTIPQKLRFAVAPRELNDFVKVEDLGNGEYNYSGFSIEVFRAAANIVDSSLKYDFERYANLDGTMKGTFDDMLQAVESKDYDGAVGEITILPSRMDWVDFTMPYLNTEIGILVRRDMLITKNSESVSLTPRTKLMLVLVCVLCFAILVAVLFWIWKFCKYNHASSLTQPSSGTILTSIMYTRLVIILVLMVILLTISSYIPPETSSSLPTKRVDNVDIKSLDDLRTKKLKVGYRQGAFVKPFLTTKVGVSESQLVELRTEVDILDKFQKGGEEGGVDALVAGTHHLVLLKEKYCENFTIVQDVTFKSSGLGFAFRTDHSTLRNKFSEAIVTLIDNGRMAEIQYATIGTLKDKECVEKPVAGRSTFQDSILMWLPAASAAFVVVLVIVMLLSYCASLCFKK